MVASATDESFPLDLFSYTIFVASALIFYVHFSTNVICHELLAAGSIQVALLGGRVTLTDIQYTCKDFSVVILSAALVLRWWAPQGRGKPTERLFVHMHGLKVLLYNNTTLYDDLFHLTKQNNKEETPIRVAAKDETNSAADEAAAVADYQQSLFSKLFPIIGFSAQLCRIFVGNHTLEKALLLRCDEVVGNQQTRATPGEGELSAMLNQFSAKMQRMDITLIDNTEWREATTSCTEDCPAELWLCQVKDQTTNFNRSEPSFIEHFKTSYTATKKSIMQELAGYTDVIFGKPGRRHTEADSDSDSSDEDETRLPDIASPRVAQLQGSQTSEFDRLMRCRTMLLKVNRREGMKPIAKGWRYNKAGCPKAEFEVVVTDMQLVLGPAEYRHVYALKEFYRAYKYVSPEIFKPVEGMPLPESGLSFTLRFEGECPRIKIPFARGAGSRKHHATGYFGVAFGKGTLVSIEVPWVVTNTEPCLASYSINLSHESQPDQKVVISSSTNLDLRKRRGFVVLPGDGEVRPPGIVLDATGGSIVYKQQYPVVWNNPASKEWNVDFNKAYVCFLNAHRSMVSDLLADWSKGKPYNAKHFCPQHTSATLRLRNFSMRMNGNMDNVLHNMKEWGRTPAAQKDVMVVLEGPLLQVQASLPRTSLAVRDEYKSTYNVAFKGGVTWSIQFPRSSLASVSRGMQQGLVPLMFLKQFELELNTTYHTPHPEKSKHQFTDKMEISMRQEGLVLVAQGDLMRYLENWWDNYFGATRHEPISYQDYLANNCRNVYAEHAVQVNTANTRAEKYNPVNMCFIWNLSEVEVMLPAIMYDVSISERIQKHSFTSMDLIAQCDCVRLSFAHLDFEIMNNRDMEMDMYLVTAPMSVSVNTKSSRPSFSAASGTPDLLLGTITYRSHRLYSDQKHASTKFYHHNTLFMERVEGELNTEQLAAAVGAGSIFNATYDPVFTEHRDMSPGVANTIKAKQKERELYYGMTEVDIQSVDLVVLVNSPHQVNAHVVSTQPKWQIFMSAPRGIHYDAQTFSPTKAFTNFSVVAIHSIAIQCMQAWPESGSSVFKQVASLSLLDHQRESSLCDISPAVVITTTMKLATAEMEADWQEQLDFLRDHDQNKQLDDLAGLLLETELLVKRPSHISPRQTARNTSPPRGRNTSPPRGRNSEERVRELSSFPSGFTSPVPLRHQLDRRSMDASGAHQSKPRHQRMASEGSVTWSVNDTPSKAGFSIARPYSQLEGADAELMLEEAESESEPVTNMDNLSYMTGECDGSYLNDMDFFTHDSHSFMTGSVNDFFSDDDDSDHFKTPFHSTAGEHEAILLADLSSLSKGQADGLSPRHRRHSFSESPRITGQQSDTHTRTPRRSSAGSPDVHRSSVSPADISSPRSGGYYSDDADELMGRGWGQSSGVEQEMSNLLHGNSPRHNKIVEYFGSTASHKQQPSEASTWPRQVDKWTNGLPTHHLQRRSSIHGQPISFGCVDKFDFQPTDSWIALGQEPSEVTEIRRQNMEKVAQPTAPAAPRLPVGQQGLEHSVIEICSTIELVGSPNLLECMSQALETIQETVPYRHHVELCADMHDLSQIARGLDYASHDIAFSVSASCSPVASVKLINDISSSSGLQVSSAPDYDLYCTYASMASFNARSLTLGRSGPNQPPSTHAAIEFGQIDVNLCGVSSLGNANQNAAQIDTKEHALVICSLSIPSIEAKSWTIHKQPSWATGKTSALDPAMHFERYDHQIKSKSTVVTLAECACSINGNNWSALLLCSREWQQPLQQIAASVENHKCWRIEDELRIDALSRETLNDSAESVDGNLEPHMLTVQRAALRLRLSMRKHAARNKDSFVYHSPNPAKCVSLPQELESIEEFLVFQLHGMHVAVHESAIHSSPPLLNLQLTGMHVNKAHTWQPQKIDYVSKFSQKAFRGHKLNSHDTLLVFTPKIIVEVTSAMWIKIVEAQQMFGMDQDTKQQQPQDSSTGAAPLLAGVGFSDVMLKVAQVELKVDDSLNHQAQLSSKDMLVKVSKAAGRDDINPNFHFSTKELECLFLDLHSDVTAVVTAGAKTLLISAAVQKAGAESEGNKLNVLLMLEALNLALLSSFKPVTMQEFASTFVVQGLESDKQLEESKPLLIALLLGTQLELVIRARRCSQGTAAITVAVQIQPSGTKVINTIEHLTIVISSPTDSSLALILNTSAGALTFDTPDSKALSIPLSAAGCKFNIKKSQTDDHFIGSALVSMDKMSSIFDAKVFPHLFHLFTTLQGMMAGWASHIQQHSESVLDDTQQPPSVSTLHIARIDVALKGIEVGARADHQMLVFETKDFRLVLHNVVGGGTGVTPTADVDFGRIHVKVYGEHRIHSNLVGGSISSKSPKVLHAKTHVEMMHQLDMTHAVELSTQWKIQVKLSDTSIIVHPSCIEHITSFLEYFAEAFMQSRDTFDPDRIDEVMETVQPLMNESVQIIKQRSAQNIERFKKNLKAGGWSVVMHFTMKNVSVCCAYSNNHTGRNTTVSQELSALFFYFAQSVVTANMKGFINNRVEGLVHLNVQEWHALFRSGVSMATLESIFAQHKKDHQFVNQIHFPKGQFEIAFDSSTKDDLQKTTVWLNSFVPKEHFTEIKIDADILQHTFELLTQYSENSLLVGSHVINGDEVPQVQKTVPKPTTQHEIHVNGSMQMPWGKCKVYNQQQTTSEGQFLDNNESAPLTEFVVPALKTTLRSVNSLHRDKHGESWTHIALGDKSNPVIQLNPKILQFLDQLLDVSENYRMRILHRAAVAQSSIANRRKWENSLDSPRVPRSRHRRRGSNLSIGSRDDIAGSPSKQHHRLKSGDMVGALGEGTSEEANRHLRQNSGGSQDSDEAKKTRHRRNHSISSLMGSNAEFEDGKQHKQVKSDSMTRGGSMSEQQFAALTDKQHGHSRSGSVIMHPSPIQDQTASATTILAEEGAAPESDTTGELVDAGKKHHRRGSSTGSGWSMGSAGHHRRGSSNAELDLDNLEAFIDPEETPTSPLMNLRKHVFRVTFTLVATKIEFREIDEDEHSETVLVHMHGIDATYVSHQYDPSYGSDAKYDVSYEFAPMLHIRSDGVELKLLDQAPVDDSNRFCINGVSLAIGMPSNNAILQEDQKIGVIFVVRELVSLVDLDSVDRFSKIYHTWGDSASLTRAAAPAKVRRAPRGESKAQPEKKLEPLLSSQILCSVVIKESEFEVKWPSKDAISVAEGNTERLAWKLVVSQTQLEVLDRNGKTCNDEANRAVMLTVERIELSSNTDQLLVSAKLFDESCNCESAHISCKGARTNCKIQEPMCLVLHGSDTCERRKLRLMINAYRVIIESCDSWAEDNSDPSMLLKVIGSNTEMILLNNHVKRNKKDIDQDSTLCLGNILVATDPLLIIECLKFKEQVSKLMAQRLSLMKDNWAIGVASSAFLELFRKKTLNRQTSAVMGSMDSDSQAPASVIAKRLKVTGEQLKVRLTAIENSGVFTKARGVQVHMGKAKTDKSKAVPFMLSLSRWCKDEGETRRHLEGHAALELFNCREKGRGRSVRSGGAEGRGEEGAEWEKDSVFSIPDSVGCVNVRTIQRPTNTVIKVVIDVNKETFVVPEVIYDIEVLEKLTHGGFSKISDAYERAFQQIQELKEFPEVEPKAKVSMWSKARAAVKSSKVRDFEVKADISARIGGLGTLDSLQNSELFKRAVPDLSSYNKRFFATLIHKYLIDPFDKSMDMMPRAFKVADRVYGIANGTQVQIMSRI